LIPQMPRILGPSPKDRPWAAPFPSYRFGRAIRGVERSGHGNPVEPTGKRFSLCFGIHAVHSRDHSYYIFAAVAVIDGVYRSRASAL
jgi:hypothetical protein